MLHLIGYLVVGAIIGWLAGKIITGRGFGLIGDIVVGIVGSFIGGFLWRDVLHLQIVTKYEEFVVALIGAFILVALIHMVRRSSAPI